MDAPQDALKALPFSTDQLLKAVDESSRRSRSILLLLTFTSFLVLMALINSLKPSFNWFKSKIEIKKDVVNYVILPSELMSMNEKQLSNKESKPVASLSEFMIQNEKIYYPGAGYLSRSALKNKLDRLYPVLRNFRLQNPAMAPVIAEDWTDRYDKYVEIGKALNYIKGHNIYEREAIMNSLSKFEDAQIEHMELIKVPILGITFHTNYLGLYSGLLLTILLVIFYFSLFREKINLKITFKRAWTDAGFKNHHYYLYEYVAMLQVLSIPKKLFKQDAEQRGYHKIYMAFSRIAKYFPFAVYFLVVAYDFSTIQLGFEDNVSMTFLTILFNVTFFVLTGLMTKKVAKEWDRLDILWNNQAFEFNIEFIFEAIGVEEKQVLTKLYPAKISPLDRQSIKRLWYQVLSKDWSAKRKRRIRDAEEILSEFINLSLGRHLEAIEGSTDEAKVEAAWRFFQDWFNLTGRKNVSSSFLSSFADMVDEIRANGLLPEHMD